MIADAIMTLSNTKSVTKEDTKMTNAKMNFMELGMNDLEIVSGGTVREFDDLVYEFVQIPVLADLCGTAVGHVPGANNVAAYAVELGLEEYLGIKADISLGFCGTGIGSDPNKYIEISTGKSLSHAEVIQRIRNYKG